MAWASLLVAGLLEVVWAYFMQRSDGFTRPGPTIVMGAAILASFGGLAFALRTLPLGTAYAVWTGVGALGTFILGVAVLGEPGGALRYLAAGLIVSGLALMKLTGSR